jgi:nucleolar GTP-binding protein
MYLRWQVVDCVGTLDRPLEINQSDFDLKLAMSLSHLQCVIVFVMDLSESCGQTIAEQAKLLLSLRPLLDLRPLVVAYSKSDLLDIAELSEDSAKQLDEAVQAFAHAKVSSISALNGSSLTSLKQVACGLLLESRLAQKKLPLHQEK